MNSLLLTFLLCVIAVHSNIYWEEHYSNAIRADAYIEKQCLPKRWIPEGGSIGLVVAFHGYSACTSEFDLVARRLQSSGFTVLSPLTVGHGIIKNAPHCQSHPDDCPKGDSVYNLPTRSKDYFDYIDDVNKMVEEEAKSLGCIGDVMATGISFGASLATLAVVRAPRLYGRVLLYPTFYGITIPAVDRQVGECADLVGLEQRKDCWKDKIIQQVLATFGNKERNGPLKSFIEEAFTTLWSRDSVINTYGEMNLAIRAVLIQASKTLRFLPANLRTLTEKSMGWGAYCESAQEGHPYQEPHKSAGMFRPGFCNFKIKHLLVVHAVSQAALKAASSGKLRVKTQFVTTERDGYVRNGMIAQAAQGIFRAGADTHMCMFRSAHSQCSNNTCGAPHSLLSEPANYGQEPYTMWWTDNLLLWTERFVTREMVIGHRLKSGQLTGYEQLAQCQPIDFENPPEDLFEIASMMDLLKVALDVNIFTVSARMYWSIARKLSGLAGSFLTDIVPLFNPTEEDATHIGTRRLLSETNELLFYTTQTECRKLSQALKEHRSSLEADIPGQPKILNAFCTSNEGFRYGGPDPDGDGTYSESSGVPYLYIGVGAGGLLCVCVAFLAWRRQHNTGEFSHDKKQKFLELYSP